MKEKSKSSCFGRKIRDKNADSNTIEHLERSTVNSLQIQGHRAFTKRSVFRYLWNALMPEFRLKAKALERIIWRAMVMIAKRLYCKVIQPVQVGTLGLQIVATKTQLVALVVRVVWVDQGVTGQPVTLILPQVLRCQVISYRPSCIPVTQAGGFGNMVFYANAGQFKMTPADQASYPRFTEMVKDLKDFVKNDKQVMSALKIYSGLTETQILDNVTFGNGPTLKITDFAPGSTSIGQYNRFEPNVLRIRDSYVRGLEQANLKSTREGTGFLLAVAILHEFIHASRHQNTLPDSDLIEYGFEFEKKAFGIIVDDRNANGYSYRFYEK